MAVLAASRKTGTMTREVQITFDCADPDVLANFWAAALGYQVQPPPEGFESWDAALEVEEGFITMRDPEGNEFCLD